MFTRVVREIFAIELISHAQTNLPICLLTRFPVLYPIFKVKKPKEGFRIFEESMAPDPPLV